MNPGNATEQPTAAKHRLPVILVTGFLGSGKTTLLLRWLRESPATGLRMGVVMNEFGAESVDSQILDRPGLPVAQVSGGCVCCAPENELDRAVTQLAKSGDCDYIVVETSGLADPDSVIDILTDTDLLEHAQLHAVVSVVVQLMSTTRRICSFALACVITFCCFANEWTNSNGCHLNIVSCQFRF